MSATAEEDMAVADLARSLADDLRLRWGVVNPDAPVVRRLVEMFERRALSDGYPPAIVDRAVASARQLVLAHRRRTDRSA